MSGQNEIYVIINTSLYTVAFYKEITGTGFKTTSILFRHSAMQTVPYNKVLSKTLSIPSPLKLLPSLHIAHTRNFTLLGPPDYEKQRNEAYILSQELKA